MEMISTSRLKKTRKMPAALAGAKFDIVKVNISDEGCNY